MKRPIRLNVPDGHGGRIPVQAPAEVGAYFRELPQAARIREATTVVRVLLESLPEGVSPRDATAQHWVPGWRRAWEIIGFDPSEWDHRRAVESAVASMTFEAAAAELRELEESKRTHTYRGPCKRCGGTGGRPEWRQDGGMCYRCHGRDSARFDVYREESYPSPVDEDRAGVLRDVVRHHQRERERMAQLHGTAILEDQRREAKRAVAPDSDWVGEVGDRLDVGGRVVSAREVAGGWGPRVFLDAITDGGDLIHTRGSGKTLFEVGEGDRVRIRARVRELCVKDGLRTTVVERARLEVAS